MNKVDELEAILKQPYSSHNDIAVLTETWQSNMITDDYLAVDGFQIFTKIRTERSGGGVAIYVRDNIPAMVLTNITVPEELECLWLQVRPYRLPRQVSSVVVCAVYIPPKSEHQQTLVNHIVRTLDLLKSKHPDVGLVILGDLNRTDTNPICRAHALKQVVDKPTRNDAILDVIITNIKNLYSSPVVSTLVGRSDHNTIYWSPSGNKIVNGVHVRSVRPLPKPSMHEFGRWITAHQWEEVLNATSTGEKSDAFYSTINAALDLHFPTKLVKLHTNDKPWITAEIKVLIKKRQVAFAEKKTFLWRLLHNKVSHAISRAKKSFYQIRLQGLKSSDPSGWHKGIQMITNQTQKPTVISVTGIPQNDDKAIAEGINLDFASVCQSRPPINLKELPAYLPAEPTPQIKVWDMYNALKKMCAKKSAGPDGLPGKLIKEFACELSIPVSDIFNSSLVEGCVPQIWKDAIVVPIPKETPATITKLRPISLTALLA
ncbi:uncharacterized protein LOC117299218 [Asterias rubens]|uniref:uncharacterized protein LOC117299218 n=1 Tax=Asterias rubens TaxID=7604 RepID=UPI0014555B5A|nr:uncharacterized protein LOC117299218 [Asterias rubens]